MLTLKTTGLREARTMLGDLKSRLPKAAADSLNAAAFDVRRALRQKARDVFDRPTPYITDRTLQVDRATPQTLAATVGWRYIGGKGTDPELVLRHHIEGGRRPLKRFEKALQRVGILPRGMVAVPSYGAPRDAFGNVPSRFIVQLLSYLGAFSEVGFKANKTDQQRARMARRGRTERGFVTIEGIEYFVSRGIGEFTGRRSWQNGRQQHLPAGIWSRKGIHGSDIQPVFMFVPAATYAARLPARRIAIETGVESFNRNFSAAIGRINRRLSRGQ